MRRWLIVGAVGLLLGVGYYALSGPGPAAMRTGRAPAAENAVERLDAPNAEAQRARLTSIRRALLASSAERARGQQVPGDDGPAVPDHDVTAPGADDPDREQTESPDEPQAPHKPSYEEALLEDAKKAQAWYERLENRYESQPVDASWSRNTSGALQQSLATIDPEHVSVASVDCRTDTCKTTLSHGGSKITPDFIRSFMMQTRPGIEHHFQYEGDETVIYSIDQKN
jgi:hypothetical protein